MTVKQLKEKIENYPDHMDVYIAERKTEFTYGLVNSVREETIEFHSEFDKGIHATADVLIIDEE